MEQGEPVQHPESLSREGAVALAVDFYLALEYGSAVSSQVTSLPVPQVLWENSHSFFGCLLSSLLSEEVSPSTKEMRMLLWILAHRREFRLVVYMGVGKVSLWFSWGRKGKAESTLHPFPYWSTCTLTAFHMQGCFKVEFLLIGA